MLKRIIDLLLSIFGLIILSPIMISTSILSFFIQGFPILFMHKRLGKNGNPFTMIKFRTMENGPSLSAEHDMIRLTKWGRFLRRSSIDELTVLFNVLIGDMSIVGPRPMPIKYLNRFNSIQKTRMNIKPGITGLAQVAGRNHLSWEEKFEYDVKYIINNSFVMDFKIIIKTFFLVLKRKNIEAENQEIMPEFMGTLNSKNEDSKLLNEK